MAEGEGPKTVADGKTLIRKETPSVLSTFPSLKRGFQELKVRVLQYRKTPKLLDIREYISTDDSSGFTRKGVTLDLSQAEQLLAQLPAMIEELKS